LSRAARRAAEWRFTHCKPSLPITPSMLRCLRLSMTVSVIRCGKSSPNDDAIVFDMFLFSTLSGPPPPAVTPDVCRKNESTPLVVGTANWLCSSRYHMRLPPYLRSPHLCRCSGYHPCFIHTLSHPRLDPATPGSSPHLSSFASPSSSLAGLTSNPRPIEG
jgi:hypothetical protein